LGNTKYHEIRYEYEGSLQKPTPFVQEALLRVFAEQYSDESVTLVVFLTDEARKRNWYGKQHT